ncbi:serine hydrolase [Rhabdochromatium marinum]|uniref:serine hydrolase n=1 Tax=Rhabdochromatium marinum TaxID=48729 RepID=UPI00190646A5
MQGKQLRRLWLTEPTPGWHPLLWLALVGLFMPLMLGCSLAPAASDVEGDSATLVRILRADPQLAPYLEAADRYRMQVLYTQIDRVAGQPRLTTHSLRQDADFYYPASLVKLPVAIFALERLKALGLNRTDRFEISPANACSRYPPQACQTVQACIEQMFVFSNNTAYNRLFEFLGRDAINARLHALGYPGAIQGRFKSGCSGESGRTTGAIRFYDATGALRYQQPPQRSRSADPPSRDDRRVGRQTRTALGLMDEPMDFSAKSYLPLGALHRMLIALVLPETLPKSQRFDLNASERAFLLNTMALRPRDVGGPQADSFRKYLLIGGDARMPESVEIINKVGLSYGFVSDVAYITAAVPDCAAEVAFFLSATLYVNRNQVMNDAQYEYDTQGYPFMKALGQAIYRHELARQGAQCPTTGH